MTCVFLNGSHFSPADGNRPLCITMKPIIQLQPNLRIYKNILAVSFTFMLHYTAVNGFINLQSSLYAVIGTFSLTLMYIGMIISSLFFAVPSIRIFGIKWSMCSALMLYIPFIGAQFWPFKEVMWPAAYLAGTGAGILWTSKSFYVFSMAKNYLNLTVQSPNPEQIESIFAQFLAIFFTIYQLSQVWGNLISSKVLKQTTNSEIDRSSNDQQICGAKMCLFEKTQTSDLPSEESIQMLTWIYIGIMLIGLFILLIFADQAPRPQSNNQVNERKLYRYFGLFIATMKQFRYFRQILITPLTFFIGSMIAFVSADFTAAYVSCGLGISSVGTVLLVYGISNSIIACACAFGLLHYINRRILSFMAIIIYTLILIALFIWNPINNFENPQPEIYFYIFATLIGGCEAIINIIVNSLPGLLFPKNTDAAFSNVVFSKSFGLIISYSYSSFICVYTKLIILISILVLGAIFLIILEVLLKRKNSNTFSETIDNIKKEIQ